MSDVVLAQVQHGGNGPPENFCPGAYRFVIAPMPQTFYFLGEVNFSHKNSEGLIISLFKWLPLCNLVLHKKSHIWMHTFLAVGGPEGGKQSSYFAFCQIGPQRVCAITFKVLCQVKVKQHRAMSVSKQKSDDCITNKAYRKLYVIVNLLFRFRYMWTDNEIS